MSTPPPGTTVALGPPASRHPASSGAGPASLRKTALNCWRVSEESSVRFMPSYPAHTHSLGNGHGWEYGVALQNRLLYRSAAPIFKATSKQMLQALPHRRHKGRPRLPATGTFRHGSQLRPSPSQSPQEHPKANRTRLMSPQKPQPSQPARGPLCPPTLHLWPGPSSAPSLHQLRAPMRAALLQAPPFHSTARGDTGQAGPSGRRGSGLSRAPANTRRGSVFHRTQVPHSDTTAGRLPQPCPC